MQYPLGVTYNRKTVKAHLGKMAQVTLRGQVVEMITIAGCEIPFIEGADEDDDDDDSGASSGACGNAADMNVVNVNRTPSGAAKKRLRMSDGAGRLDEPPCKVAKLDDGSSDEEELPDIPSPKRVGGAAKIVEASADEEELPDIPPPKRAGKAAKIVVDSDDEEEIPELPTPKRVMRRRILAPRSKAKKPAKPVVESSDEDDDDEVQMNPKEDSTD